MPQLPDLQTQIHSVLQGGDILFIVPPFATAKNSVLGVHLLQALAVERGYKAEVLYLNILLASIMGMDAFEEIAVSPFESLWRMTQERLFARSAYELPPFGKSPECCRDEARSVAGSEQYRPLLYESADFDLEQYLRLEQLCHDFVQEAVPALASLGYPLLGCTARMGQTNCSIALLNGVKKLCPETITFIGGSNCKGELAEGIASLSQSVDFIFSGDSESSFVDFLTGWANGKLPSKRVISGRECRDLDSLPLPDYSDFSRQMEAFFGPEALEESAVSYESSRGCWWGTKQGCFFCSERESFRQKSPAKVLEDLGGRMREQSKGIYMCDIAMPLSYRKEVFPQLLAEQAPPKIQYQAKVNFSLRDLIALKRSGVEQFTVGIEALSTGLLSLMNKGATAGDNLQLLRHARSLGIYISWLLLWGFPGDRSEHYRQTLKLLPLIHHLQPPITCRHLILARFSPYFERAPEFRITNIRPWAVYDMIYPEGADLENLAQWFVGDYPCEAHEEPELIRAIAAEVERWKRLWRNTHLVLLPFNESYMILDNRDVEGKQQHLLEPARANAVMTAGPLDESEHQRWAIEQKLGVALDSRYIPLVTAAPELLLQFESKTGIEKSAEII